MNNEDINFIFEQINNLKKPDTDPKKETQESKKDTLQEVLNIDNK